jgi:hypothetical protein
MFSEGNGSKRELLAPRARIFRMSNLECQCPVFTVTTEACTRITTTRQIAPKLKKSCFEYLGKLEKATVKAGGKKTPF